MRLSLVQKSENAHDDSVWNAAYAPGSNLLVTGSVDELVKVWKEEDGGLSHVHTLTGAALGAVSVAVDSTGAYGAVCTLASLINVWRMEPGFAPANAPIQSPPSEAWGITFVPHLDGTPLLAIAGGSSNKLRLWNVPEAAETLSIDAPSTNQEKEKHRREKFVLSVAASPDGRRLAAGCMDGGVMIVDVATGQIVSQPTGHFKPVRSLTFTADGQHLLTACDDMHVNMYDATGGALVESFSGHENWVLSVSVHPDGTAFASGGADSKVKLWDLGTRTCVQTLSDHSDQVWGVTWRSDGSRVASVSDDRSICLYDFA